MKIHYAICAVFLMSGCAVFQGTPEPPELRNYPAPALTPQVREAAVDLYHSMNLEGRLELRVFLRAYRGYHATEHRRNALVIADFSQPSTAKRLFVFDMDAGELLFQTWAAHGVNTGENTADTFSNTEGSRMSSPGFYLTAETYRGKHGRSLRLDGLERGINDNARLRYIVLHGAGYVNADFIAQEGRLGRSWGCPAVPDELAKPIIKAIRRGAVFYIHTDNPDYLNQSLY